MKKKEKIRRRRLEEREKEARREKLSKVKKGSLFLSGIFFAFAISVAVWQMSIVSFDEAVRNPNLREKYLSNVVEKIGKPDAIEVVYSANQERPIPAMMTQAGHEEITFGQSGKKFVPERIKVFPHSFSKSIIVTEDDFIASLTHEYHHVQQAKEDQIGWIKISSSFINLKGNWDENLFYLIRELDAFRVELGRRNISPAYRENRMNTYLDYYDKIWAQEGFDPEFIKKLKIEFFERWIPTRPEFKMEIIAGRKSYYLEHPTTKRKYYLPEELVRSFPGNP